MVRKWQPKSADNIEETVLDKVIVAGFVTVPQLKELSPELCTELGTPFGAQLSGKH